MVSTLSFWLFRWKILLCWTPLFMRLIEHKDICSSTFPQKKTKHLSVSREILHHICYSRIKMQANKLKQYVVCCCFCSALFICYYKRIQLSENISKAQKRNYLQYFISVCIKEDVEWVLQKHSNCTDQHTEIKYMLCDNFWERSVSNYKFLFSLWLTFME